MKKTLLIIVISICFSACSTSQQIFHLNNTATINLPKAAVRLDSTSVKSFIEENFKSSEIDPKLKYSFKSDEILISFNDKKLSHPLETSYLSQTKGGLDEINKLGDSSRNYKSEIRKINNNGSALFLSYKSDGSEYFRYFYLGDNFTYALNGILQFRHKDSIQAVNILNNMLNSIQVKK